MGVVTRAVERRTVADAMLHGPKTLPADASLGEVRALLADEHVHLVLLVSGGRLVGTVTRADLDTANPDPSTPALESATLEGRTLAADAPLEQALSLMAATEQRRLAVVGADGRLLGLLCLKRRGGAFCSDSDIASREADAAHEG